MAKLYFKYGAMGSSKTAQALISKFNYEEKGLRVCLIKPAIDNRDGEDILTSRIGLSNKCIVIKSDDTLIDNFFKLGHNKFDVIIADECQFFTSKQIDILRYIVDIYGINVICYGLRTDFCTSLFSGSKRLFEVADSISEIKSMCKCGNKAIINARIDKNGKVTTSGDQIDLGGNEKYVTMCSSCWNNGVLNRLDRKV